MSHKGKVFNSKIPIIPQIGLGISEYMRENIKEPSIIVVEIRTYLKVLEEIVPLFSSMPEEGLGTICIYGLKLFSSTDMEPNNYIIA